MTLEHSEDGGIAGADTSFSTDHPVEQDAGAARSCQRRRRSNAEKRALVDLAAQPGSSVPEVAACFDVAPSQIYAWRKQLADGELDDPAEAPVFARVELMPDPPPAPTAEAGTEGGTGTAGKIVIAFPSGVRVRVDGSVDPAMLALVLAELGR